MHPIARILQLIFLVAGFVLLGMGFVEQDEDDVKRGHFNEWVCKPDAGSKEATRCVSGGQNNYSVAYGSENGGLSMSLAGVGLIAASISIAVGGTRRASAPAGMGASYGAPAYNPSAPPMPGPPR